MFIGNLLIKLNVTDTFIPILIVILILYLQKLKPEEGIYLLQQMVVIY